MCHAQPTLTPFRGRHLDIHRPQASRRAARPRQSQPQLLRNFQNFLLEKEICWLWVCDCSFLDFLQSWKCNYIRSCVSHDPHKIIFPCFHWITYWFFLQVESDEQAYWVFLCVHSVGCQPRRENFPICFYLRGSLSGRHELVAGWEGLDV